MVSFKKHGGGTAVRRRPIFFNAFLVELGNLESFETMLFFSKIFSLITNPAGDFFQILVYHKVYLKTSASSMLLNILYPNLYRVSLITPSLGILKKKKTVAGLPFATIFRRRPKKYFYFISRRIRQFGII